MAHCSDTDDYRSLFLADAPMMDMRAPVEFSQGAFPNAVSLPLMEDDERSQVGICYKHSGADAAIALGHQLVCGEVRAARLEQWSQFARNHPNGYLYCFRGGLRSKTVQQWLLEQGIDYPLVKGGYKAMRQFLLSELDRSVSQANFVLIAGKTGTGKTRVIEQLSAAVDLEGRAGHRGSSFGQLLEPQPGQIDFENLLSIDLLKLRDAEKRTIFLEDEGHLIGQRYLPKVLLDAMKEAPMLLVEQTLAERINIVIADYVIDLGNRYQLAHLEEGKKLHRAKLQNDLHRIRKRLGGERHTRVSELLDAAFAQQWIDGDLSLHGQWIGLLLSTYYDPMYEYQLEKRAGEILFSGSRDQVVAKASAMA
ncbi:MAG: tRNA 2-selenouridine synthase [Halioglobus sp.]|jgi:tRNA 2-selenouridine synthase